MNCKNCGYGLKLSRGDFEKILCTYEEGECVKITELEQQKNWLEGCKSELSEHLGKANDRIVELETTCNKWFEHLKNREEELLNELNNQNAKYNKQIAEVEQEVKLWKKASENNSYKAFQLKQENAELKAVERMALYSKMSDRLAKAEELLLELYDCIPSSMADSCKETLQKVALFFKDSEVEK